jgi:FkbM family methyltransferase
MTFLSYAQNFEDVMLWRALRSVGRGFYIDVGAAHPDTDSVTRAFYDRGWHGINVEPEAEAARRLADARLRDVTLRVAVGESAGTAEFFSVPTTGLSTLERDALPAIARAGFEVRTERVEMTTLAAICRDHAPRDIHFLKIDVEGGELAVLRGADFAAFRPWIVVVEATAPMSTEQTHHAWEPILLSAEYRFVYFDGLNRFYVAAERHDSLAPGFAAPPNVFDDFLRVADTEWARRLAEAQARAATVAAQAREATRAMKLARDAGEDNRRLQQALVALQAAHADALAAAERMRAEEREARAWLAAMRASTSWRVTAPLRRAISLGQAALRRRPARPAAIAAGRAEPAAPPPSPLPSPAPQPRAAPSAPSPDHSPAHATAPAAPRGTVHQFHSGSAVGDAITQAMLLTRTLLRGAGYASEIYVEHVDPLLSDELRPLDELPPHADYVLIARHSMGFDAFDRIAALPAPKILIYHNITPPELLAEMPGLQHYARLGREQLARWRPLVHAALADSEYNTIELRRLGFDDAQACTLLFDIAALRGRAVARSAASPRQDDVFTILCVGRVIASKGQDDLVAAYARFRATFAASSRLVLVGRYDGASRPYAEMLRARVRAEGLDAHVTLTGLVSDEELHGWYNVADLYVSVSRHEGFGVPLAEAMAHGVPVLALPSGAIPYTLDGAGMLLADAAPDTVAAAMGVLATDPALRAALAEQGQRSLDRFRIDRQLPRLLEALTRAGARPRAAPPPRGGPPWGGRLDANMRFTLAGHVLGSYSLAAINRAVALALEAVRPGATRLLPVEGQSIADLSGVSEGVPEAVRAPIAALAARPPFLTGPEMVISQHYPVLVPEHAGDIRVALFFWEESLVPAATIALLNGAFDGVLTASRFVAKALIDSGLSIPARVIGHVPDLAPFHRLPPRRAGDVFTFLHVSSGFPRKGVDILLAAFRRAFRATDAVRLVVKVFPNPHNDVAAQIDRIRQDDTLAAPIVLVDGDIPEADLLALYGEADAMVLPSRGEGFNLPAAEAMAAGLPLIVTGFGGHMDFCTEQTARLLEYRLAPSASHLATPHSLWVEPDEADLVAALREAVADRAALAARARRARDAVAPMLEQEGFVRRLTRAGLSLLMAPPRVAPRIGWISTWRVRCGIAGYSRQLLAAMMADPGPGTPDITVFSDMRTQEGTASEASVPGDPLVRRAWRLGDPDSVAGLATAIAAADPHVLVVQHQPALLPWGALAELLGSRAARERAVVVTLHNTRHLMDIEAEERQRARTALAGIARVLVHTIADLDFLKKLGLAENVTLLPHGAPPPRADAREPRLLARSDAAIIGCYGFFLPRKGIDQLIQAVALLRQDWPALRLRLVNAEYGIPESAAEIAACRALAARHGVPVEWHTDFLTDEASLALLASCDIVALPYQVSNEASSAALRTALGAGGVVAVTPLPLFDEAGDAVVRFGGHDPASLAAGLGPLLDDVEQRRHTQRAAALWLSERGWPSIAARLRGMLTGLARADPAESS